MMAQVVFEQDAEKGRRCSLNLVRPGKMDKLRLKLGKKEGKAQIKLDELFKEYGSSTRYFDSNLYETRVRHLEGLGVPIFPLVKLLVAKEIVWQKKKEDEGFLSTMAVRLAEELGGIKIQGWSGDGSSSTKESRRRCSSEKYEKEQKKIWLLKDGTRKKLEEFGERGLPSGLWMGVYLEVHAPSLTL
jgi:hypothetical protein